MALKTHEQLLHTSTVREVNSVALRVVELLIRSCRDPIACLVYFVVVVFNKFLKRMGESILCWFLLGSSLT